MARSKGKASSGRFGAEEIRMTSELLEAVPVPSMILDGEGLILRVNSMLAKEIPFMTLEGGGLLIFDRLPPERIREVLDILKSDLVEAKAIETDIEVRPSIRRRARLTFSSPSAAKGMIICALVLLDPAEGSAYRMDLEAFEMPMDIVGPDLGIISFNDHFKRSMNFLGKKKGPVRDLLEQREVFLRQCQRTGKGGEVILSAGVGGADRRFLLSVWVLPGRKDRRSMIEVWTEITDIIPGAEANGQESALASELLETSNAVIVGLDPKGIITLFNKGAQKVLGYDRDAAIGTAWFDYLVEPKSGRGILEVFQWNISTGFKTRFENKVRSKVGNVLTVSWENTVVFDPSGDVSMVLMVGQDITQMKHLEENLRLRGEELSKALEEASIYNDLMLHDIHNSTAAIMGYVELLTLKNMGAEKRLEYTHRALEEVKKSSQIVKEVRLLSRIEPAIEPSSVPIRSAMDALAARLTEIERGYGTRTDLDASDLHVLADEYLVDAIHRVIEFSVRNSARPGGRITVTVRRSPSLSNMVVEPVHILISVPELSIPRERRDALFRQVPRKGETSHVLGLYLVKRIIDRYGGLIWIDDDPESGMPRFSILLREAI